MEQLVPDFIPMNQNAESQFGADRRLMRARYRMRSEVLYLLNEKLGLGASYYAVSSMIAGGRTDSGIMDYLKKRRIEKDRGSKVQRLISWIRGSRRRN